MPYTLILHKNMKPDALFFAKALEISSQIWHNRKRYYLVIPIDLNYGNADLFLKCRTGLISVSLKI